MGTKLIQIYGMYLPPAHEGEDGRVVFRFLCDENTAAMVESAMTGAKVRRDGDCVIKTVKASDVEKFVMGAKLFPKIIEAIQHFGSKEGIDYAFDETMRESVIEQVNKQVGDRATDETIKEVDANLDEYMDKLLQYIKENMNNPQFIEYLKSVGTISLVGNSDLLERTKPSPKNTIMIMAQWVKSGHIGLPTILATQNQWSKYFNRKLTASATPLYYVRPFDVQATSLNATLDTYGVQENEYMSNQVIRKAIDQLKQDKDYGLTNNHELGLSPMPYYDVSETYVVAGLKDTLADALNAGIGDSDVSDEAKDKSKDIDISSLQGEKRSVDSLLQNAAAWAQKNDAALYDMIQNGADFNAVVDYLVMSNESIERKNIVHRGVDDVAKSNMVNILKAFVYLRYGVMEEEAKKYIARIANRAITKNDMYALNSGLSDIVAILGGMNESYDGNLMRWMLSVMGMSVADFNRLPESDEELANNINGVAESFRRSLNRINEGRRMTHGFA